MPVKRTLVLLCLLTLCNVIYAHDPHDGSTLAENSHDHVKEQKTDHTEGPKNENFNKSDINRTLPGATVKNESVQNEADIEQEFFVRKIFDKYGYKGRITFEGFEHLLESLGLAKLRIADHDIHDHISPDNQFRKLHNDHIHVGGGNRKKGKNRKKKNRKRARKLTEEDMARPKRDKQLMETLMNDDLPSSEIGGLENFELLSNQRSGYYGDERRKRRSTTENAVSHVWELFTIILHGCRFKIITKQSIHSCLYARFHQLYSQPRFDFVGAPECSQVRYCSLCRKFCDTRCRCSKCVKPTNLDSCADDHLSIVFMRPLLPS